MIGYIIDLHQSPSFSPTTGMSEVKVSYRTSLRELLRIQFVAQGHNNKADAWKMWYYISGNSLPCLPERESPQQLQLQLVSFDIQQNPHLLHCMHSPEKSMWQSAITANTQQRRRLIERSKVYFPWTLLKLLVCFFITQLLKQMTRG